MKNPEMKNPEMNNPEMRTAAVRKRNFIEGKQEAKMEHIKAVLFDLDGTLLPMDQEKFVKSYLKRLAAYMAPYGYDPQKLVDAIPSLPLPKTY